MKNLCKLLACAISVSTIVASPIWSETTGTLKITDESGLVEVYNDTTYYQFGTQQGSIIKDIELPIGDWYIDDISNEKSVFISSGKQKVITLNNDDKADTTMGRPETVVIDWTGKSEGKSLSNAIPQWLKQYMMNGNVSSVENLNDYSNKYVFIAQNTSNYLGNQLKLKWNIYQQLMNRITSTIQASNNNDTKGLSDFINNQFKLNGYTSIISSSMTTNGNSSIENICSVDENKFNLFLSSIDYDIGDLFYMVTTQKYETKSINRYVLYVIAFVPKDELNNYIDSVINKFNAKR